MTLTDIKKYFIYCNTIEQMEWVTNFFGTLPFIKKQQDYPYDLYISDFPYCFIYKDTTPLFCSSEFEDFKKTSSEFKIDFLIFKNKIVPSLKLSYWQKSIFYEKENMD